MRRSHLLRKGRISQPFHYYAITCITNNRECLFTELASAQLVILQLLNLEDEQAIKTICYTLMPDHLHWQFQLLEKHSLAEVIKRMKGRSAQAINIQKNKQGKVWQADYYEHHIKSEGDLINQARYIVANPLRAGLVDNISDYAFWDCIYLKQKGYMP